MHFSTHKAKVFTTTVQKKLMHVRRWQDAERKEQLHILPTKMMSAQQNALLCPLSKELL